MQGDFTRNTFDRTKHFSRVLKQQGRVELDSDFNEAMDILLHQQRTVASDLIGQHGAPPVTDGTEGGFHIHMNDPAGEDFSIGRGRYYVDGILCENEGRRNEEGNLEDFTYLTQPDYPEAPVLPEVPFMVYLEVWERYISALEDDYIREKALNGPDTASRAKVVWQVKVADRLPNEERDRLPIDATCESIREYWVGWVQTWRSQNRGLLKAATGDASEANLENPCIIPPESRYRGAENQLYRVEIHTGGTAENATFKWSRDNGSMTFPVIQRAGGEVTVGYLGRDSRHSLERGQWVELVDDNSALGGEARPLGKVKDVDYERMIVTVDWPENPNLPDYESEQEYKSRHVLLRRWDHTDKESVPGQPIFDWITGTLFISESDHPDADNWLTLENGIRISFAKSAAEDHYYQSGDYWLIPARFATGDVEWPWQRDPSGEPVLTNNKPVPEKLPPHGVEHHYAPLAVITYAGQGEQAVDDCRRRFISGIDQDTDLQVRDLTASGRVGLGVEEPKSRLALKGIVEPNQGLLAFFSETADVEYDGGSDKLFIFQANSESKTAFLGGDVGIGTQTPTVKLEVAGDLLVQGNASKPGGGGWTETSDESLKKNVKSLRGALDSLLQLRGVSFEWKEPGKQGNLTGNQIGMIAQDVEKVFPAWVGTSPDGTKNITFRGFEALMVEALRDLNTKIDTLVHRMAAIEQQMNTLSPDASSPEPDAPQAEKESEEKSEPTPKSTGKRTKKSS